MSICIVSYIRIHLNWHSKVSVLASLLLIHIQTVPTAIFHKAVYLKLQDIPNTQAQIVFQHQHCGNPLISLILHTFMSEAILHGRYNQLEGIFIDCSCSLIANIKIWLSYKMENDTPFMTVSVDEQVSGDIS